MRNSGIAGWVDWSMDLSKQKETLKNMTNSIIHRGPDAEGFWFSKHAAFGHRRLIVIDPEGGLQPMLYKDGETTVSLTFNGEIYNYQELRIELEHLVCISNKIRYRGIITRISRMERRLCTTP